MLFFDFQIKSINLKIYIYYENCAWFNNIFQWAIVKYYGFLYIILNNNIIIQCILYYIILFYVILF